MYEMYIDAKCPNCGKSHYRLSSMIGSTCMGGKTIVKDGVMVHTDPNWYFRTGQCLECEKVFTIISKQGEPDQVKLGNRDWCTKDMTDEQFAKYEKQLEEEAKQRQLERIKRIRGF